MSRHIRWIGRGASFAALATLVVAGACGQSDSDAQTQKDASSEAAVVKTSGPGPVSPSVEAEPKSQAKPRASSSEGEALADGPRLSLEKSEHDFGKIYDTNPHVYDLKVTNTGNRPLTIQKISTSCGCTSTNKDSVEGKPIPPGESRMIEVKYKPKATAEKVTKTVTIQSDDFIEPVQRFKISAQLIEPARLDPPRYQMGQIRSGEGHKTSFYIISPDPRLEILSVEAPNFEYVEFAVAPEASTDPDFPGRQRIDVTISPEVPTGNVRMSFIVKAKAAAETDAEPVELELNGMILGHVQGELTNNPRFLRVRNVGPGETFEERTMLYSENAREFKVTNTRIVDTTVEDVTIEVVALEPFENDEPGYWLIVRGRLNGDAKGAFQGKVLVETDIPNESEKAIIFNGIVRRSLPTSQN